MWTVSRFENSGGCAYKYQRVRLATSWRSRRLACALGMREISQGPDVLSAQDDWARQEGERGKEATLVSRVPSRSLN